MQDSILQRVAAGDAQAVQDCLDRYKGLVWSLARRRMAGPEAEDAVQEIFIAIWESAGRYDPKQASEAAFVAMIARRRLIDRLRRAQRRPQGEPLEPDSRDVPITTAASVEASAEASLAARALSELKPREREVLLLSICQGMSHSEISTRTELPLGTVKTYVRRSLIRVREALEGRGRLQEAST